MFGRNNILNGVGVWGEGPKGTGVFGHSNSGSGIAGSSRTAAGVYGLGISSNGLRGVIPSVIPEGELDAGQPNTSPATIAIYGENQSQDTGGAPGAGGFGLYGISAKGHGLLGATNTAGGGAVVGATNGVAGAYAAIFYGPVAITGGKSAAVKNKDGSHSLLYCVEAPESWFEDFGTGTLVNGKADVKLDPDFMRLIDAKNYHVFFTEYGGHHGLHVKQARPDSFTVEADSELATLKKKVLGDLSGTFSYRVVGKRTDIDTKRLTRVQLPPEPDHKKIQAQHGAAQGNVNPLPAKRP